MSLGWVYVVTECDKKINCSYMHSHVWHNYVCYILSKNFTDIGSDSFLKIKTVVYIVAMQCHRTRGHDQHISKYVVAHTNLYILSLLFSRAIHLWNTYTTRTSY